MSQKIDEMTTEASETSDQPKLKAEEIRNPPVPTLTILYHPSLRRIGERVLISELMVSGRDAKISRNAPDFAPPRPSRPPQRGTPLNQQRISRKPLILRRAPDGGFELDARDTRTAITIDGTKIQETYHLSHEAVEHGVIIELAERVALLFHYHVPQNSPENGDLGLIGESTAIIGVREEIRRVANVDVAVLIRGETGSGKELVAQAIHAESPRCQSDMVSVNLGAIPVELAAAELFGSVPGAFTGAKRQPGYFRSAHKTTLFLDEIGEAPGNVQAMLLRTLETKEVFALGSQRGERVDVRLITATDADLRRRIADDSFRAPLFHRLASYELFVPPLRHRRDDIVRLLIHFLGLRLAEFGETERLDQTQPAPWLPMDLVTCLVRYPWPGNVRELRNVVRQLVINSRGRDVAELPAQLQQRLIHWDDLPQDPNSGPYTDDTSVIVRHRAAELSDEEIRRELSRHQWDIKATAEAIGISRTTLYRRIHESPVMHVANDLSRDDIVAAQDRCNSDIDCMCEVLEVSKQSLIRRMKELGLI